MSQVYNFSDLQTSTNLTSGDQLFFRKNNSLSGAAAFARITFSNLEKNTTVYNTVNNLSTEIKNLSSYWTGGSDSLVKTYAELTAAIANPSIETIVLGNDITFAGSSPVVIPRNCSIKFNGYKFIKTGSLILYILGEVDAGRVQVFSGWSAGDIRGTFKNEKLYPEWWGLQGSNETDGRHDIAINCAIKTANPATSIGRTISLAAGEYYVGRPIEAENLAIRIEGAGSGATSIITTKSWTSDTWESSERFRFWTDFIKYKGTTYFTSAGPVPGGVQLVTPLGGTVEFLSGSRLTITDSSRYNGTHVVSGAISPTMLVLSGTVFTGDSTGIASPITLDSVMEVGANNASSVIWIGGNGTSFWSGVEGVTVNCQWATINNPTKRISGISWKASVEENTIIRDVDIRQFSGFGIGGGMYDGFNNSGSINVQDGGVTNGLCIENFWIKEATRRGALPIFINKNSFVNEIRCGTIDCTTTRAATLSSINYPYFRTWPLFGILAYTGNVSIKNVHFEGMGIGVHIATANEGSGYTGTANLENLDGFALMRHNLSNSSQLFASDPEYIPLTAPNSLATQMSNESLGYFHLYKTLLPTPNTSGFRVNMGSYLFRYSTLVTVGTTFEKASWDSSYPNNYFTNITMKNLYASSTQYILRDLQYGIDLTTLGGVLPNEFNKNIAFYSRGLAFGLPTGTYPFLSAGTPFNDYWASTTVGTWITNAKPIASWDKTYYTLVY